MTPPTRTLKDDLRTVAAFKAAPRLTRWAASGKAAETLLEGLEPGSVVGWISTGRQTGDPGLVAMTATEVLWVRGILNFTLHRCSLADTEVTVGPDADHAVFRTLGGTFQAAVDAPTKEALFALLGESPREAVIHMSDGVERIAEWDAEGAESLAMRHMITIGFRDAQLTNPGPDDGLDVISAKGAAQVKHHHKPVGSKDVQQHFGAAASYEHKLFYALSGYTPKARAEAERLGIVLFSYRPDGVVVPENQRARILAPSPILPQGISQHQVLKAWANRRS